MGLQVILPLALPVLIVLFFAVLLVKCYKKCPPDKLIVVYGKKRGEKGEVIRYYKCVRGAVLTRGKNSPFREKRCFRARSVFPHTLHKKSEKREKKVLCSLGSSFSSSWQSSSCL